METLGANAEKTVKRSSSKHRAELEAEVLSLWGSDLSSEDVREIVRCRTATVREIWLQHYGLEANKERKRRLYQLSKTGERNPMKGKTLDKHHNYIGRASDSKGYFTVVKPEWYDSRNRRVFEHHVNWAESRGLSRVPSGYDVHHINKIKADNTPDNLVLMSKKDHCALHAAERRCIDYPEKEYGQVTGSTALLLQREDEIVSSLR